MTLEKTTKIVIALFIIFLTFGLASCVTKKKFKESQTLLEQRILSQTENRITNYTQNIKTDVKESLLSEFKETLKEIKESTTTNENETTTISGTITAEDGKDKSATIGNTVIKTNGANVTFQTTSTKDINKQLETINKELTKTITQLETSLKTIENEFNEFKNNQLKVNDELKSEKNTQTKETNRKGFNFLFIILLIIAILTYISYRFRHKIPFIGLR